MGEDSRGWADRIAAMEAAVSRLSARVHALERVGQETDPLVACPASREFPLGMCRLSEVGRALNPVVAPVLSPHGGA